MKIESKSGKVIVSEMTIIEFEKKLKNDDKFIMLFDVWSGNQFIEALQIEKNRIERYG